MGTIMDLIMSALIGGTLLLIAITTNEIASESMAMQQGDLYVQESLIAISQILEGDLRNMGFGVADTSPVVVSADSTSISYRVDLNKDFNIDTVTYFLGPTSELQSTPNELDRFLYRQVRGEPRLEIGAVTRFGFKYIRRSGESISVPVQPADLRQINEIETLIEVQNPYALLRGKHAEGEREALYSSAMWKQTRLATQNLRR